MYKVEMKMPIALGGDVTHTVVSIMQVEPYCVLTAKLDGDQTLASDEKLIEAVKEEFYSSTYFNRAEKEYVEQLKNKLAESDKFLKQTQLAMFEATGTLYDALEEIAELKQAVKELKANEEAKDEPIEIEEQTEIEDKENTK